MEESQKDAGGQGERLPVSRSDAVLIGMAVKRRWGLTDEMKKALVDKTFASFAQATDERAIVGLAKVLQTMEAQNQADEHLADKNNRLDNGKPTEIKRVYTVEFDE
jgi:hypothetical protein